MVKYKQNAPDLGDNVLVKYGRYGTEFAAARLVVTEEQRPGSVFIQWVDRGDRAWVAQESVEKMEDLSKGGRRSRRGSRSSSVAPTTWVNQKKIKKEVKKEPKVESAEKKPQKKAAKATNNNSDKDKKTKVKVESVPKKTQKKKKVSSRGKAKDKGNSSLGLEDTDDEAPREPVVKRTKLKKTTGKKGSSAGNESSAASKETGSILSNETDKDNRSRSTSDNPPFKDRATKQEELTSTDEGAGKTAHSSQGKSIQGNEKRPGRTDALDVEARDKLNDGQEATTTSKSGSNGGSSMKVPRKGQSKSTLEKTDSAKAGPPLAQQSRQQLTDGGDPKLPKETPKLPKELPKLPKEVPQSSASQPAVAAEKLQRSSVAPHPNRTANASTASGAGNKSSATASAGGDSQSAKSANTDEEVLQTRVPGRAKQPMTNVSTCSTASQQHTAKPKPKTKIIVTLSDDSTDEEEDDAGEASTRVSHSTTNSSTVRNAPVHIAKETTKAVPRDPASKKASQNNSAVPAKSLPTTGDQSTSSSDRNVLRPKPRKDPNVAHGRPGKQNKARPEQFTGSLSSARTLEPTRPNPRKAASGRKEPTKTTSMVSAGSGASQVTHYRTLTSTASEVAACCDLRVQITRFEDAFIQLHGHPPKGAAERAPLATTYSQYRELKRAIRADAACRIQALFRGARLRWDLMRSDDSKISDIVRRRAGRKEFSGQTVASENESGTILEESHRASRAVQTTVGINRTAAVVAPPRVRTSVVVEERRKESVIARGNDKPTAHGRAADKAKSSANATVRESKTRDREKPRKEPVVENRAANVPKLNDGNIATRQEPTLCKQESTTSVTEALLASGSTAKLKEPAWISLSEGDLEPAAAQSDRRPQEQNADSRVQNPLAAAATRAPQANEAPATSAQMSKNKAADPVPSLPAQKQSTHGTTAATAPIARPPTAGLVPQAQNADSRVQNPLVATETRTPQANEARATLQKPQMSKSKATDPVQSPPSQKQSTRGTAAATEPTGIARPSPPKQPTAAAPTAGLLPQKRTIDETKSTVRAPVACPSTHRHSVDLARAATVPVARPSPPKQMKAMAPKPSTSKQSTANPAATIGKPSQPSMDTAKAAAPIIVRTTSPQQSIAKPSTSKWPTNAANATAAATTALLSPKKRPLQVEDAADAADKASTPAKKRLREDGGAETQTRNTVPSTNQDRTSTQRQEGSTPVRRRRLEESKSNNNEIFDCVERLFFDADPHKTTVGEIVDKCEKIFGAKFSERREKDIEKYLITLARKHVHL
ncbi:expressed unknown protein [Seminavis robusta]|uniref:Uncharacterized protein n=1 Tax=Seminavis robusta TaxID=568900 RepID=A0A9N8D8X2_9STRA|nr:expressed unknown protein [Seminavis robusta]|eukprot:Sro41_g025170.1 n/a (1283) ;mRNA; f:72680-76528